ncbi:MAG: HAD-IC family P-type ATPase [Bacilli bacterium]|nr:HAD-IC family P-type ATPase [Bacilli bacterium]
MTRYNPDIKKGLSSKQVKDRYDEGLVNYDTSVKTKSVKTIIYTNVFTLFNIVNTILAIAVITTGSFKNLLFMGGVICNTIISIIQELRSKNTLDKLQVINETKIKTIRDGEEELLGINDIVLDDITELEMGNQIVVDSIILDGEVEVNESFITGEADTVFKKKGDMLLSGSFIVSGKVIAKVEHIGLDNYTAKISANVTAEENVSSEIMRSLNKIIMTVSFLILPLAILLYFKQLNISGNTTNEAILNTVAALIGMIPEGLVLLTSTVLAVGVVRLAKSKVLVQDLYCIEALARVDTICLDKTGTITEGVMEVVDTVKLDKKVNVEEIIANMNYALCENNPTGIALSNKFGSKDNYKLIKKIPFSSSKKYMGCEFEEGEYLIGAPEFILKNDIKKYDKELSKYTDKYRVIALCIKKKAIKPIAFILLQDIVRKEAKDTLNFFKRQGVTAKIISGDNPNTVYNIAVKAGLDPKSLKIDASTLKTDEDIYNAIDKYTIFGRVSPEQKRKFILALQRRGHVVAMTGDGVNDVLALKESDCSVAMASGTDAAKNVSQLVLLDSNFASMPSIVDEGRRNINNIERSASLFLVKTIYATVLAILFLFINSPYPYIPIQLTLSSVLTVGIPSVILALEPNHNRIKGRFLPNVLRRAIPPAVVIIVNVLIVTMVGGVFNFTRIEISTLTALVTTFTCFVLLFKTCTPFNLLHKVLYVSMLTLFLIGFFGFRSVFNFSTLSLLMLIVFAGCVVICLFLYKLLENGLTEIYEYKK